MVFLYDGDCAFCTSCARWMRRYVPTTAAIVPWQSVDLDAYGVTEDQARTAVQFVRADGTQTAGPEAIGDVLAGTRGWWRAPGFVLRSRPVLLVAWPVYRFVARHRGSLPGTTCG